MYMYVYVRRYISIYIYLYCWYPATGTPPPARRGPHRAYKMAAKTPPKGPRAVRCRPSPARQGAREPRPPGGAVSRCEGQPGPKGAIPAAYPGPRCRLGELRRGAGGADGEGLKWLRERVLVPGGHRAGCRAWAGSGSLAAGSARQSLPFGVRGAVRRARSGGSSLLFPVRLPVLQRVGISASQRIGAGGASNTWEGSVSH